MRGMNSETVDLIYLDPPFKSDANYAAPIGSKAAGAAFKDIWTLTDVDVEWINLIEAKYQDIHRVLLAAMTDSDKSYLTYMAVRILEMKRLLKPTGSIFLHCDWHIGHYLKILLDAIFGKANFRNEIVWHYSGWNKKLRSHLERRHDVILFYARSAKSNINYPTRPWRDKEEYIKKRKQKLHIDDAGHEYVLSDGGGGKRVRRYLDDAMHYGVPLDNVWQIPKLNNSDKEKTDYLTQKPLALLRRIIEVSTNQNDMVLDPFCGCATTCVAAEQLLRKWVGIDISPKAVDLIHFRMREELGMFYDGVIRTDIPKRNDIGDLPNYRVHKNSLYGEQAGNCEGCGEHFKLRNLTVDHIIPRSKGGTDHIDNLQLLCGHCNSVKGDRNMEYLRVKLQLV